MREIEEALQIAERSGDDFALAHARVTLGFALVHRTTTAERDRGQQAAGRGRRDVPAPGTTTWAIYRSSRCTRHVSGLGVEIAMSAIPLMRAAVDHLFREGQLLGWGIPATGVLVETLLDRGTDGDVAEAEAAIERLATAPAEEGLVMRDIWLLRLRALLARAHGDDARLSRIPGSLPRHGENAWLRRAYRVGRGDAMTSTELACTVMRYRAAGEFEVL